MIRKPQRFNDTISRGEPLGLKPWSDSMEKLTSRLKAEGFLCVACNNNHVTGPGIVCGPCAAMPRRSGWQ